MLVRVMNRQTSRKEQWKEASLAIIRTTVVPPSKVLGCVFCHPARITSSIKFRD